MWGDEGHGAGMRGCRDVGVQDRDMGQGMQVLSPSPGEEGDQGAPVRLGINPAMPQTGTRRIWGGNRTVAGAGVAGVAGEGPGTGQWDHCPGLNPTAVPQERQNIIRYWLENLRAKQGESLHNIHFLEGQPISEYGTARHGVARHGTATPLPHPVPMPCRGGSGGHKPGEGPLSPRVPIPGAACRAGWWVRGVCAVLWLGSAADGHRPPDVPR